MRDWSAWGTLFVLSCTVVLTIGAQDSAAYYESMDMDGTVPEVDFDQTSDGVDQSGLAPFDPEEYQYAQAFHHQIGMGGDYHVASALSDAGLKAAMDSLKAANSLKIPDYTKKAPKPKWKVQAKRWARTPGFEQRRLRLYKKERTAKKKKRARKRKATRVKRINRRAKVSKENANPSAISHKDNRRQRLRAQRLKQGKALRARRKKARELRSKKRRKRRATKRAKARKAKSARRLGRRFKKIQPKIVKYCEVSTKMSHAQGRCRAYRRFCRLYKKFGLHGEARRHCNRMKRVHRRLVRASNKLHRKAARTARRAHRAQRRAKRAKARKARRARRKKKAAKLKKMFAWTKKERKKTKKTKKKTRKKASWKMPSVKGLFGKKKKKKTKGKKTKKKKKTTKKKTKKKKARSGQAKRHGARKAKRAARRAARRARRHARKQAHKRAKARHERMHKRVKKLKTKLATKDHKEKQRKARKTKKKRYVPPRKPKRPEGHARPMKKVPKPPKVDHHVYGKNYISKKFLTKSKSHTRRRRWSYQADSKKAKKDTKKLVGDLQHPVLKKKVSAKKQAAAKKKAKKSAKKFFKAIAAKNHPGPPKKMPIPMPAKAYKRNAVDVQLHPKQHPLHPMRNPVSGGASEASTIISEATATGVLMVSDALINASKNGKEYIKIDGAKYLRKDLDPGKKVTCEHWKIRNAASVCESYRTAHKARKAKKEKAQAKKKKHSVKRPAYGHRHRNVDRHGKVSGKPRNLGEWFNHQLQSNKPLAHRIKKHKKRAKRSHHAAHKRKKSKHEARLKRSLKKAQAAELLATRTLAAARMRSRVSNGEEFEGDDMLHDLVKAQVLLHRH